MRDLSPTLEAAQQSASMEPYIKVTLTHNGDAVMLWNSISNHPILSLQHHEELLNHSAEILLQNSDGYFTDRDLKGWQAVISWGLVTGEGNEYSDSAPLTVIAQQLSSSPGKLVCALKMVGIPNMLAEDKASETYAPNEDDDDYNKTVKTLLTEIITATMDCYSHCHAYEVVFDSEDSLIDSFKPKDKFRIFVGWSRLAQIRRLIDWTKCVTRFGNDGKVHIFKPTTTGTNYDYEYDLDSGHSFFLKSYRKTLVIPNYIVVENDPAEDEEYYSGYAVDQDSIDAFREIRQYEQLNVESDSQAEDIAEAILSKYQLNAQLGSAEVPINCGAEVLDYVKVTDSREGDYRVGNIGSLTRKYSPRGRFYSTAFTFGGWLSVRQLMSNLEVYPDGITYFPYLEVGSLKVDWLEAVMALVQELWAELIKALKITANMIDVDFLSAIALDMGQLTAGEIRIGEGNLLPDGYATSGSQNTLTDSAANWGIGEWVGEDVRVSIGGTQYQRTITANTATLLTFNPLPDGVAVSAEDKYWLGRLFVAAGDTYYINGSEGTATGGSTTTLVDTTQDPPWDTNEHKDDTLAVIIEGRRYHRMITSNTSDTLTFDALPGTLAFTGFRLWRDPEDGLGKIAGYLGGTLQFYTGSDGVLYAGGGSVKLDEDGITIGALNKLIFKYAGGNTGYIFVNAVGNLQLSPAAGKKCVTSDFYSGTAEIVNRLRIPVGADMFD